MALIVEDGTGLSTAQTFGTLAEAEAYYVLHGAPTGWAALTSAQKEAVLAEGALQMDSLFWWYGERSVVTQALCFPRYGLLDRYRRPQEEDLLPTESKAIQFEVVRMLGVTGHVTPVDTTVVSSRSLGPSSTSFLGGKSESQLQPTRMLSRLISQYVYSTRFGATRTGPWNP